MQSFIMNSHEVFIHIHQGCFAGTGAIVRLPQCQWSKPDGYGKISQCITTTKHSKAKNVCIFLGIYCKWGLWKQFDYRCSLPSEVFYACLFCIYFIELKYTYFTQSCFGFVSVLLYLHWTVQIRKSLIVSLNFQGKIWGRFFQSHSRHLSKRSNTYFFVL